MGCEFKVVWVLCFALSFAGVFGSSGSGSGTCSNRYWAKSFDALDFSTCAEFQHSAIIPISAQQYCAQIGVDGSHYHCGVAVKYTDGAGVPKTTLVHMTPDLKGASILHVLCQDLEIGVVQGALQGYYDYEDEANFVAPSTEEDPDHPSRRRSARAVTWAVIYSWITVQPQRYHLGFDDCQSFAVAFMKHFTDAANPTRKEGDTLIGILGDTTGGRAALVYPEPDPPEKKGASMDKTESMEEDLMSELEEILQITKKMKNPNHRHRTGKMSDNQHIKSMRRMRG